LDKRLINGRDILVCLWRNINLKELCLKFFVKGIGAFAGGGDDSSNQIHLLPRWKLHQFDGRQRCIMAKLNEQLFSDCFVSRNSYVQTLFSSSS